MTTLNRDALRLDLEEATEEIVSFIRKTVEEAGAAGVVVGLSGGVDSSVAAALSVRALGRDRVLGVLMPTSFTPPGDMEDARELATQLGIRTELVEIQDVGEAFFGRLGCDPAEPGQRIPAANVWARVRMVILYYYANLRNLLVVGPGDRSETLIGYFTKHGDGAADLLPIRHLYKTQVRALARHLGVPEGIASKPSSPQLYPGHRAEDEIPLGYERLDPVLVSLFDRELPPEQVSRLTGVPLEAVREVLRRFERSEHKRVNPPTVR